MKSLASYSIKTQELLESTVNLRPITVAAHSMEGDQGEGQEEEEEGDGLWALPEVTAGVDHPGGRVIRPGIVHRLDKGTTGLLVAAKDERTLTGLAAQFKAHTVLPICRTLLVM